MEYIEIKSYGKINFTLDIIGKRRDGYHNIESIMQTIDIYDTLKITKIQEKIEILSDHRYLPLDKRNLIYKTYKELSMYVEKNLGVRIEIEKHIPIAAGLGGGSSNAAATLIAINKLYKLGLSQKELALIAKNIGMDVIFFTYGGLKYVHGKGDKIEDIEELPLDMWIVIINPNIGIPTVWAYNRYDIIGTPGKKTSTKCALKALKKKDYKRFVCCIGNDFSYLLEESYPEIKKMKKELATHGIKYINISGSGPTVYGIIESQEEGKKIITRLREKGYFVQLVKPISHAYKITEEHSLVYEYSYRDWV